MAAGPSPPLPTQIFYAFGQFAQTGVFDSALPFAFFYYTAVLGLNGALVGAAFALSLLVDAVFDPLVGSFSDNIASRFGRRLPPMVLAAPLIALAFGALFAPPHQLSQGGLFLWLLAASILVRATVSVFNVPYFALAAEMSDDYAERSRLVAYRTLVVIASSIIVYALGYSVFFAGPGGLERASAYPAFGWSIAAVSLAACGVCCAGIFEFVRRLPQPRIARVSILRRLPGELAEVFGNASFRTLFFSAVIFWIAVGLNASLQNHAYVYVWGLTPASIQLVVWTYLCGILLGVAMTSWLSPRWEKRTLMIVGIAAVIIAWTLLIGIRALGLFVPRGAAALLPVCANAGFAGAGVGLILIAYPSMMADAADEHEALFGSRREGLYFAGLGFGGKAANGLGVFLAGTALSLIRFPSDAVLRASTAPPEAMARELMAVHGPLAAVLGAVALAIFLPYSITKSRHQRIAAKVRSDRASEAH